MTPQESRERFEEEIRFVMNSAQGRAMDGKSPNEAAYVKEVVEHLHTYTTSLLTHAMQQIEGEITKWEPTYDDMSAAHVDGLRSAITILQSLLPEQNK